VSKVFRNLTFVAIAAIVGVSSASATVAVEVFKFTGDCTDCTGTATATLILLAGYELGTPLNIDDLYSFNYSSNLISDLSIYNDPTATLSGVLPVGLGPADVFISGVNGSFNSSSDGAWSAFDPPEDVGVNGMWTSPGVTATPEPSTVSIMGISLLIMMLVARRVNRSRPSTYRKL
jgi:hypothetical protein